MNIGKLPMMISVHIVNPQWSAIRDENGRVDHFECEGKFGFDETTQNGMWLDNYVLNYGVVKAIELKLRDGVEIGRAHV